jgi:hypothetical protein
MATTAWQGLPDMNPSIRALVCVQADQMGSFNSFLDPKMNRLSQAVALPAGRSAVWDAMTSQFPARIWLFINYVVTYCTSEALSIFFS